MRQADYARHKGWDRSRVTRMKETGLVVMQGQMVDVAATDALIVGQSDPALQAVRDRHARQRTIKAEQAANGGGKPA